MIYHALHMIQDSTAYSIAQLRIWCIFNYHISRLCLDFLIVKLAHLIERCFFCNLFFFFIPAKNILNCFIEIFVIIWRRHYQECKKRFQNKVASTLNLIHKCSIQTIYIKLILYYVYSIHTFKTLLYAQNKSFFTCFSAYIFTTKYNCLHMQIIQSQTVWNLKLLCIYDCLKCFLHFNTCKQRQAKIKHRKNNKTKWKFTRKKMWMNQENIVYIHTILYTLQ